MTANLSQLVDAVAGLRVIILGDAMLDSYLEGTSRRLCQEAPVPIVALDERRDLPGGAANAAVNLHEMGGRVALLSVVGADVEAETLRRVLEQRGVATAPLLARPERRTLTKSRVVASGQIMLRLDQGSTSEIDEETESSLVDQLVKLYPSCDALVISDYGYGVVTPRIVQVLADLQARYSRVVVADSRRLALFRDMGITACKPNFAEAIELLGTGVLDARRSRADALMPHGERLLDLTGAQIAAVTLDNEGAIVFERGRQPYRSYARAARQGCVAGAGDTFTCAMALALAGRATTTAAVELASAAAAVVVACDRTAVCSAHALREYVNAAEKFIDDRKRLATCIEMHRQQGRRIAFTNGCFDILHRGHISYLNRAKALGDVLIVGVNSDEGIRRLKGPARPINTLEDRIGVLAALSCIDHLVAFEEDTPCNLIRIVKPDVFVKGGDYTRERLPDAPLVEKFGGIVQILPYLSERSTTRIIERIQAVEK
jgi:D-beta-D-heptose 7-phosphate kinase / D-beta-D-heptose 1-phosphate adenosyltransferase